MTTGRQVIPATTVTELEISGHFQLFITSLSNNIDLVNSDDTDATNGYTLTADTEYFLSCSDKVYFYAASETTVMYRTV